MYLYGLMIEQFIALAMMQYARWNPYRGTASRATTDNGFTQRRSDLLGINLFSLSQTWLVLLQYQ